ncbi:SprT-like protein [Halobacillus karajensis]|uniref:Protein SprT-like n=1 Tax=Halobacillus karajensis TaxID=195088 RepID=A0A024P908_9BACI|nr:SprT family protein [Halobacillus karajensis]CDQ21490.1 SprT-like family protein [Halobacillus karajensis]CDQ25425.1 SprT-like family protein [Halobacillus karajensis]CDQ29044.1 SprT-like family protein [Halobacillus karajensis]SEI09534.1 SprT-like protein [Halobacillus karajensis]
MKTLTEDELQDWTDKLSKKYFDKPFMHEVYFNSRLRTTGGRYIPSKKVIEINPKYVVELDGAELEGIIKHELCHYHLHIEGKGFSHRDPEFKALLKKTGSPRHCSPLPSQQRERLHHYVCAKCGQSYKRKRRVDTKRYRCGKCKGSLKKK